MYGLMFFYKDYSAYLVNLHVGGKITFYTYKYDMNSSNNHISVILLLIKYIGIRYKVLKKIHEESNIVRTNLFLYNKFNNILYYSSANSNCLFYHKKINDMCKYHLFYHTIIYFIYNEYKKRKMMERYAKLNYRYVTVFFDKFRNLYSNSSFSDIKNINSIIDIYVKTNTNNYFLNKFYLSHTMLNI